MRQVKAMVPAAQPTLPNAQKMPYSAHTSCLASADSHFHCKHRLQHAAPVATKKNRRMPEEQKLMMSNSSRERWADATHMLRQELLMAMR